MDKILMKILKDNKQKHNISRVFSKCSDKIKDNKEIVLQVLKIHGMSYIDVSERLKRDKEVIQTALINDFFVINYIPENNNEKIIVGATSTQRTVAFNQELRTLKSIDKIPFIPEEMKSSSFNPMAMIKAEIRKKERRKKKYRNYAKKQKSNFKERSVKDVY